MIRDRVFVSSPIEDSRMGVRMLNVPRLNQYRLEKSEEPPLAYPGAPLDSERAKQPPLPEIPYKPYEKAVVPEVPYAPYAKPEAGEVPYIPYGKPAVPEAPYKPYPKKPGAETPYKPYKGI